MNSAGKEGLAALRVRLETACSPREGGAGPAARLWGFLIWDCVCFMGGCIRNTLFRGPAGIPTFFSEGVSVEGQGNREFTTGMMTFYLI